MRSVAVTSENYTEKCKRTQQNEPRPEGETGTKETWSEHLLKINNRPSIPVAFALVDTPGRQEPPPPRVLHVKRKGCRPELGWCWNWVSCLQRHLSLEIIRSITQKRSGNIWLNVGHTSKPLARRPAAVGDLSVHPSIWLVGPIIIAWHYASVYSAMPEDGNSLLVT